MQPKKRADQVDGSHDEQYAPHSAEIHAVPGNEVVQPRHQLGLVGLARSLQPLDDLRLGDPGWQRLADGAGENQVGDARQDLGRGHRAADADDREKEDQRDLWSFGAQPADQPLERPLEVLGLLPGPDEARRAQTGTMLLAAAQPSAARYRRFLGPAHFAVTAGLHRRCLVLSFVGAHATSSADNCEYTISR